MKVKDYLKEHQKLINVLLNPSPKKLKQEGLGVAGTAPSTSMVGVGYNCKSCGFGSFFKKCSRCGAENE